MARLDEVIGFSGAMSDKKNIVEFVIGPDGQRLTIADLPPSDTRRWVIRRKAEVVAAVRGGLLSLEDCVRALLDLRRGVRDLDARDRSLRHSGSAHDADSEVSREAVK